MELTLKTKVFLPKGGNCTEKRLSKRYAVNQASFPLYSWLFPLPSTCFNSYDKISDLANFVLNISLGLYTVWEYLILTNRKELKESEIYDMKAIRQ